MLELRPSCEHCDRDLPASSLEARICTFECTFCAACTDGILGGICPNCGGELVARPIRPPALVDPTAGERRHAPVDLDRHRSMRETRDGSADHPGVVLRRYADAWLAGDIETVVGCYADDFVLHYVGSTRFAGDHAGLDAALAVLAEVSAVAPRRLVAVDDLMVSEDGGALVVREELTRDGETVELRRVLRYRVNAGRLAECWLLDENQTLIERFWRE